MADDSLDILVKISSDTAGARAAAQELDALAEKARQHGEGLQSERRKERETVSPEQSESGRRAEFSVGETHGASDTRQRAPTEVRAGGEMAALCRDAATKGGSRKGGGDGNEDGHGFRSQTPSPQPSPNLAGEQETERTGGEQMRTADARADRQAALAEGLNGEGGAEHSKMVAGLAGELRTGREESGQAMQELREVTQALAGQRASLQQATAMIAQAVREFGGFTEEVLRLADAVSALGKTARETNSWLATIESQLTAVHNP